MIGEEEDWNDHVDEVDSEEEEESVAEDEEEEEEPLDDDADSISGSNAGLSSPVHSSQVPVQSYHTIDSASTIPSATVISDPSSAMMIRNILSNDTTLTATAMSIPSRKQRPKKRKAV
jgi:hypothetical protein